MILHHIDESSLERREDEKWNNKEEEEKEEKRRRGYRYRRGARILRYRVIEHVNLEEDK